MLNEKGIYVFLGEEYLFDVTKNSKEDSTTVISMTISHLMIKKLI